MNAQTGDALLAKNRGKDKMSIGKLIRSLRRNLEQTSDPDLRKRLFEAIQRLRDAER